MYGMQHGAEPRIKKLFLSRRKQKGATPLAKVEATPSTKEGHIQTNKFRVKNQLRHICHGTFTRAHKKKRVKSNNTGSRGDLICTAADAAAVCMRICNVREARLERKKGG